MRQLIAIGLLVASPLALAVDGTDDGGDRIRAGDTVVVTGEVDGDLILAGGEVDVNAAAAEDLMIMGGAVKLAGSAQEDVFVAGGEVAITGEIRRDLRVAGGEVRIGPTARVGGNAKVAGGEVSVAGIVDGNLRTFGGSVLLDGIVAGDVRAVGGEVRLGPNARIKGNLTYSSKDELQRDPAAEVTGSVSREEWKYRDDGFGFAGLTWIWTLGVAMTALLALLVAPGFAARVTDTVHDRFPVCLALGLAALVVTPLAFVLLAVTVIGLPVAMLVIFAFPILLFLGYLYAAIALGDIGLQRFRGNLQATDRGARMLAAFAAIVGLALLARVPVLGGIVVVLALMVGMGALVRQFGGRDPATA